MNCVEPCLLYVVVMNGNLAAVRVIGVAGSMAQQAFSSSGAGCPGVLCPGVLCPGVLCPGVLYRSLQDMNCGMSAVLPYCMAQGASGVLRRIGSL
jgi:hypothetical protein